MYRRGSGRDRSTERSVRAIIRGKGIKWQHLIIPQCLGDMAGGDTDRLDADNEGPQVEEEVGSEEESSSCHSDKKSYG